MNKQTFGTVGALLLCLATAYGFYWLWSTSKGQISTVTISEMYKPVEIESIKADAEDFLADVENNGNIPIPIPREKMGRENPFNNY